MNGDITLEALRQCQRAFKVISPFIIFDCYSLWCDCIGWYLSWRTAQQSTDECRPKWWHQQCSSSGKLFLLCITNNLFCNYI